MYEKIVWGLYYFWYGRNESIEREEGDEEVYSRVLAARSAQKVAWAKRFGVPIIF